MAPWKKSRCWFFHHFFSFVQCNLSNITTCWSGICLSKWGCGKALILLKVDLTQWNNQNKYQTSSAAPQSSPCSSTWGRSAQDPSTTGKQSQSLSPPGNGPLDPLLNWVSHICTMGLLRIVWTRQFHLEVPQLLQCLILWGMDSFCQSRWETCYSGCFFSASAGWGTGHSLSQNWGSSCKNYFLRDVDFGIGNWDLYVNSFGITNFSTWVHLSPTICKDQFRFLNKTAINGRA